MKKFPMEIEMGKSANITSKTKIIALIAIFSALFGVLRRMDTIPMIGVQGAKFSLSDILPPIYGVVLGPFAGGISVIIGTFIGIAMGKPVTFLFLDFLPAFVNTIAAGLLVRRKWFPTVLLNITLLVVFLANPLTSIFITINGVAFPFAWLHILAFIALLSPLGRKTSQWIESLKPKLLTAGLATLAFVGTMMQHLMGNILYEVVLNQLYVAIGQQPIIPAAAYAANWAIVFFLYPWERLMLIILSVVVGVPLIKVLKQTFFRTEQRAICETKQT
jgi:hypothetical protein